MHELRGSEASARLLQKKYRFNLISFAQEGLDFMTQQEFQERYAEITGLPWSQLEEYLQVAACHCGKTCCPGWQMITLPTRLPPLRISVSSTNRISAHALDADVRGRRNLSGAQV